MSVAALDRLKAHAPTKILQTTTHRGDECAIVDKGALRGLCIWLRDTPGLKFDMLTDLTAVDYLGRAPRFEVVYQLYSVSLKHRLRLKAQISEDDATIETICDVWRNANWLEREVWDLYGIRFINHPDMRRILMYDEFEGHPLRKDYPKQRRQPRVRRPQQEIDQALAQRPGRDLTAAAKQS